MKKLLPIFLFTGSLFAQVQIGRNVQIGGTGTGGSGPTIQTNGTNNTTQTTLNFVNPPAFNGLTFTFSNPTLGNQTFTLGGTLGNAGLANPSMTINGTPCTLGASCTPPGSGSVGTAGQLQMRGATSGSFAASALTDNGTTVSSSEPVSVADGTGKAGNIGLLAGTAPAAAPTSTVQINAPTAVTAYSVNLPGTQGTGALTNDGAGNLSWTTAACATCVVATSPGAGIARFAGSTQTVTSAELSGDATTSGSNVVTVAKVAGTAAATVKTRSFGTTFGDTGGSTLTAGSVVYFTVPYACTIAAWNITVDAGTATVDVWKIASGTAIPTVTNTITASALPAISTGTAIHSTTLTGWTTSVTANDIFGIQLKTVATAKFVEVDLQCNQ